MFTNASGIVIYGGTFNSISHTSRGIDILLEWVATGAFHNSDELYDTPKCHPRTRVAVLKDIMKWVGESESARDEFIMWLFGPAGAGKSAIAKRISEIAADMGMLIATFFFSRTSPTRSNKDRLIATLAYQLAQSIPETRSHIESAIEQDPTIFTKNLQTQIDMLLIKPFQSTSSLTQTTPSKKLIIIDGLDECNDSQAQVAILEAISRSFTQHKFPMIFLVVSRPEPDIVISFNCHEPLRFIHRRLALDDTYRPCDDIRLFFSEKFEHIKHTHLLRSTIPTPWPTPETLVTLVERSSGQFIYAAAVVKFVESRCHRPSARLNIILGISPPGTLNPFAELDGLYTHLLSSVDDIQLTLRVLSFYVMTSDFASRLAHLGEYMSPELFLSLEPGDIQLALMNLSSIITYHESSGVVQVLHASLVDFLSDKHRSTTFYIDKASTCLDFVRRILRYVKGLDGIRAGDIDLFRRMTVLHPCIPKGQLRSDILNFDIDAFIHASVRWQYKEHPVPNKVSSSTMDAFDFWATMLHGAGLEEIDEQKALDRVYKALDPRLQIYQSNWRLRLLLILQVADLRCYGNYPLPYCRFLDILLEMDDHNLHLVDQNALDLRHMGAIYEPSLINMVSPYVNGDTYASAAIHCMRFLSSPPKFSQRNECSERGLINVEWKVTCSMTLEILCRLLQLANASPVLAKFINNHDIHPEIQKSFPAGRISAVNLNILAFLSRTRALHINQRARQRPLVMNDQPPSIFEERSASSDEREDWQKIRLLVLKRSDRCCSHMHVEDAFEFKDLPPTW